MYKVYAIDHKFRCVDKEARKEIKNQRSISTSETRKVIGISKKLLEDKKLQERTQDRKRKAVVLPPI